MTEIFQRINFFKGLFMKESDWKKEQQYHMAKQRFHNRFLHTPGVVFHCLQDLKAAVSESGTVLTIAPGYAIDGEGRDLYMPEPREIVIPDLQSFNPPTTIYITIRYNESLAGKRENTANPMYAGFAYVSEDTVIEITTEKPDNHHAIELGRVRLSENPGHIRNPAAANGTGTAVIPAGEAKTGRRAAGKAVVPASMKSRQNQPPGPGKPFVEEVTVETGELTTLDELDLSHVPEAGVRTKTRENPLTLSDLGVKLIDTPMVVIAGNRKQEDTNILIEQYPKKAVPPMYMVCVQSLDGVRTRWSIVCTENDEGSLDYNLHIRNEATRSTTVMCRVYRVRL